MTNPPDVICYNCGADQVELINTFDPPQHPDVIEWDYRCHKCEEYGCIKARRNEQSSNWVYMGICEQKRDTESDQWCPGCGRYVVVESEQQIEENGVTVNDDDSERWLRVWHQFSCTHCDMVWRECTEELPYNGKQV